METEIRRLIGGGRLGDHFSNPIGGKPINHDAVEADELSNSFYDRLREYEAVAPGLGKALRQLSEPRARQLW